MAVDGGYGPKGYPKFDPNGAPEDWIDLEAVGQFAAKVGNRMVGTAAERAALTGTTTAENQRWVGLEFFETDTGNVWQYEAAGWVQVGSKAAELTALNSYVMQPGSGIVRNGQLVTLSITAEKAAGVDAVNVATIPAGFRPQTFITVNGVASVGGTGQACTIVIGTAGDVRCWTAAAPNRRLDIFAAWLVP